MLVKQFRIYRKTDNNYLDQKYNGNKTHKAKLNCMHIAWDILHYRFCEISICRTNISAEYGHIGSVLLGLLCATSYYTCPLLHISLLSSGAMIMC